jgi:hypothetical protein
LGVLIAAVGSAFQWKWSAFLVNARGPIKRGQRENRLHHGDAVCVVRDPGLSWRLAYRREPGEFQAEKQRF